MRSKRDRSIRELTTLAPLLWLAATACDACAVPGDRCQSSSDCATAELCVAEVCRRACNNQGDCASGERCSDGICWPGHVAGDSGQPADATGADLGQRDASASDHAAVDSGPQDRSPSDAATDAGPTDAFVADQVVPTRIVSFSCAPCAVAYGATVELNWQTSGATSCRLDGELVGIGGAIVVTPEASHVYELDCAGPGGSVLAPVEVVVSCAAAEVVPLVPTQVFHSQAALQSVFANTSRCFEIAGDLTISDSTDIVDLGILHGLVRVNGNVSIYNNAALTGLTGLEALQEVTGRFALAEYIDNSWQPNPLLRTVTGLSGLHIVGAEFDVTDNSSGSQVLTSLHGLEELRSVGGSLFVRGHNSLTDLRGLRRLSAVGAAGSGWLYLERLRVTNLDGLQSLQTISGGLALDNLLELTSVRALSGLVSCPSLILAYLPLLSDLSGLENIGVIDERLVLLHAAALTSLAVLSGAFTGTLQALWIENSDQLTDLAALEPVRFVQNFAANGACVDRGEFWDNAASGFVYLDGNLALTNLSGLTNLDTVECSLQVVNTELESLADLGALAVLDGNLLIDGNQHLATLGLPLQVLFTGHDLVITNNPRLPTSLAQDLANAWTVSNPQAYNVVIAGNAN